MMCLGLLSLITLDNIIMKNKNMDIFGLSKYILMEIRLVLHFKMNNKTVSQILILKQNYTI